ncbi:MAG: hypothetical protein KatS3mg085_433 [Candidatus Dojkabacteria bacterium]|nr:MAG: hypothetical protein KatS3mg085_433 [Candidatus Dojkabacteria bacterium]
MEFNLVSEYKPAGDQPRAIDTLSNGLLAGNQAPNAWLVRPELVKLLQWQISYKILGNLL